MAFCAQCEKQIEEGQVCDCSASAKPSVATDKANIYERNMRIVPDCLRPNENEIPVRQYNIAVLRNVLRGERAEGRMQVTNKRVIFRAAGSSIGGRITLQQEFAIDELAGIEATCNYRFGFIYLLIGLFIVALSAMTGGQLLIAASNNADTAVALGFLLGFGGLALFFVVRKRHWGERSWIMLLPLGLSLGFLGTLSTLAEEPLWYVFSTISGIITIYGLRLYAFKPNLLIHIKNKCAMKEALPIKIGRGTRGFWSWWQSENEGGFSEVFPTPETDEAIREIGAMIADIQKLGDSGLKKWVA